MSNYLKYLLFSLLFFAIGYLYKPTYIFQKTTKAAKCAPSQINTKVITIQSKCNVVKKVKVQSNIIEKNDKKTTKIKTIYELDIPSDELLYRIHPSLNEFFVNNFDRDIEMGKRFVQLKKEYENKSKKLWEINRKNNSFNNKRDYFFFEGYEYDLKKMNLKLKYYDDLKKEFGDIGFKKLLFHIQKQNEIALEKARIGDEYRTIEL